MYRDKLIDAFVEKINSADIEPVSHDEIPEYLRIGEHDEVLYYQWKILRYDKIDWINNIIGKLPGSLPNSYLSLITRYAFPAFEAGDIFFFANTGLDVSYELSKRLFEYNLFMNELLFKNGFIQIGQPAGGSFDSICFDLNRHKKSECYIVQLDHNEILLHSQIRKVKDIAPSFQKFVEQYLGKL